MSKTINLLNNLERKRNGKYSIAVTKDPAIKSNGDAMRVKNPPARDSRIRITWVIGFLFFTLLIAILGFNFKLYSMVKNYTSERDFTLIKLNKIEELINKNNKQANENLASVNSVIQENIKKISQLENTADAQAFAIDNLTKAKNALFKKLSSLEAAAAAKPGE